MTQVEIRIATQLINTLPDPGAGNHWAQVLNHCEYTRLHEPPTRNILEYTNVPARFNGIPSVRQRIQTANEKPVTLTRELQEWIFRLFEESAPTYMTRSDVVRCWRNAFTSGKAFCNFTGWDKEDNQGNYVYADYIQGTGLNNSTGFKLQPTICHGALIKVKREFEKAGIVQVAFEILDAFDSNTLALEYEDNRHLIFPAINWYRFPLPYGKADPFPYLGGYDVPIPMLGNHVTESYIERDWIRYLDPDEPFPPNFYWESF